MIVSRGVVLLALSLWAGPAFAGPRDFMIYAPGMGGSSTAAQPFLQTFFREIEKALSWPARSANGEYFEDPKAATDYIEKQKPGFAMLSPGLFLELACAKSGAPEPLLSVVGVTAATSSGKYHLVAKSPAIKTVDDLKGKHVTSNHLQNRVFVSRVIFAGKVDAEKFFQLKETNSPIKPFKDVDRGEAEAALIDDAQLAHMKELPFGRDLHVVFSSEAVPPFPVVAFPKVVKPAEREAMKKALLGMCGQGGGGEVCKSLQITRFEALDAAAYKSAQKLYCK
jgi:ABC-type phosphate/phosphonate transport system substrate-binding protein